MRKIETEHEAKGAYKQDTCYLCGERLDDGQATDRDHVPPKSIFLPEDRKVPLILPAHKKCNQDFSIPDEQTKHLVAAIHGKVERLPVRSRAAGTIVRDGSPTGLLLQGYPLHSVVHRIMRGCHMALYGQTLPMDTPHKILTPLPAFDVETGRPLDDNFLVQHERFCRLLKLQRKIGQVDFIHAYGGKFRFECVCAVSDDGSCNFVICAIDIYGWHKLGDQVLGRPQGCIACYQLPKNEVPAGASTLTSITIHHGFREPLNPWEKTGGVDEVG